VFRRIVSFAKVTLASGRLFTRRSALRLLASAPTFAIPPVAASVVAAEPDAMALSLEREINRLDQAAAEIDQGRIRPSDDAMHAVVDEGWGGDSRFTSEAEWLAGCQAY
jgi:hypothetical protein